MMVRLMSCGIMYGIPQKKTGMTLKVEILMEQIICWIM